MFLLHLLVTLLLAPSTSTAFVQPHHHHAAHHRPLQMSLSTDFRQPHFEVHAPTVDMSRAVACAQGRGGADDCRLDEIQGMIRDLKALNADCETGYNPQRTKCQVDAVEARQLLVTALELRAQLLQVQEQLPDCDYLAPWWRDEEEESAAVLSLSSSSSNNNQNNNNKAVLEDHSFQHFRDFRRIAAFESH